MSSPSSNSSSSNPMNEESVTPGPIIHIRADSDSTLDDLFNVALKPQGSHKPLQVPLRMRNLPESFFRQPMHQGSPNHSRENSLDNSSPFSIHHSRAHSSPATLQQTLAVANSQTTVNNHVRQTSYDPAGDMGPLPPGWEMAKTPQGQIYFMNHISKTTQWEDPRKQQTQQQAPHFGGHPSSSANTPPTNNNPTAAYQSSPRSASPCHNNNNNNASLGPLPPGWDQGETPEGEVYFINHATKKTTWFDPRLPRHHQRIPQKDSQRHSRLQRLENERRALQQRQAELKKVMEKSEQFKLMKRQNQEVLQQTQEMLMRQTLNGSEDQPSRSDIHNRQESADSGLGMGSNFNLGSIPEDMTGMEMETDLDTTLTDRNANPPSSSSSTNANNNEQNADMDSDALIPSLTGDLGDELSNDIMQDVQSILSTNKGDNLTWL